MKPALEPFVDMIIASLEQGVVPWRQTWKTYGGFYAVRNNGVQFRGVNQLILSTTQTVRGYASPVWLTYNQALDAGGQVRKGMKGTAALLYRPTANDDQDQGDGDGKPKFYSKVYSLFNADQCDGLSAEMTSPTAKHSSPPHKVIDMIKSMGVKFVEDGAMPHYSRLTDSIHMPAASAFETEAEWVGTALHESAHSTGAEHRLNRPSLIDYVGDNRVFEELVAEIAAAMMGGVLGLPPSQATWDNHVAYIGSWAKYLKNDRNKILEAGSAAQAACDYLTASSTLNSESDRDVKLAA